ncbi:YdcH family protein [Campylobacter corcagiensis]|uniref:DUF465 domain-containing protein n=1 Tax=Campylobacter corcagiensis TaxID=1448857 RepID=A0A7M1LE87_9BACT|nr:DUF465 domain-containing protein [Campylobacter corcagiensis]QKF64975.1 DUF465 domain-containing protein [Campylobacter corcagiensis]QOQ86868.1 DUF465 domain-containing protein [Campylobacter corcagiensis]
MFPEYRELMSSLKGKNARFDSLMEKHDELDHKVTQLQNSYARDEEIQEVKQEKLRIKEEIYKLLKDADK